MARIRTVKPDYFQHEGIFDAEVKSGLPLRLAYVGLWLVADRRGLFRWRPRALKTNILPYDDAIDFAGVLEALASHGFIVRYVVNGEEFGAIPAFLKHQRPHVREVADPGIPEYEPGQSTTKAVPGHNLGDGQSAGKGREGKGREGEGDTPASTRTSNPTDRSLRLSCATGDHPDDCAKALRELLAEGVPEDRIDRRIDAMTEPIGVWTWKRTVLAGWRAEQPKPGDHGPKVASSNGAIVAKIAEEKARAAVDLEAFKASGFKTRREWVASRKAVAS